MNADIIHIRLSSFFGPFFLPRYQPSHPLGGFWLVYAFSITTRLPSILATSSSRGLKGKALSLTSSDGRLMLCLPPDT